MRYVLLLILLSNIPLIGADNKTDLAAVAADVVSQILRNGSSYMQDSAPSVSSQMPSSLPTIRPPMQVTIYQETVEAEGWSFGFASTLSRQIAAFGGAQLRSLNTVNNAIVLGQSLVSTTNRAMDITDKALDLGLKYANKDAFEALEYIEGMDTDQLKLFASLEFQTCCGNYFRRQLEKRGEQMYEDHMDYSWRRTDKK